MAGSESQGYALNQTRQAYLATRLDVADGHWSRLRGLIGVRADEFRDGRGLWITPCHGVHTLGMRFPIDVLYLNSDQVVLHIETKLAPWRFAPIRVHATSVLELPPTTLQSTGTRIGDRIEICRSANGKSPSA
jgi:uncharacterized membrane protein (UPF0127 family)